MIKDIVFVKTEALLPGLELELRKHIRVVEAIMDEVIPYIKEFKESGVNVVISRGYTANLIREKTDLHVVNAEISTFDVLQSIYNNRNKISSNETLIALVRYSPILYDIDFIEKVVGLKIKLFTYKRPDDILNIYKESKSLGIKTIFGGPTTYKYAPQFGLQAILVQSNKDTIMQAIQKAMEIHRIRKHDKELNEYLKAILALATEGIIGIKPDGHINFINPSANRILGIKSNQENLSVTNLFPEKLVNILLSGAVSEKVANTYNGKIVVNSIPIKVNKQNNGFLATFNDSVYVQSLEEKIRVGASSKGLTAKYNFSDIIGKSTAIQRVIQNAEHYAKTEATILITGESGTGKELFAQSIHQNSNRKQGPFIAINCAALSANLLESELFGYEEGAFTGAKKSGKPGIFELANQGTLFLDEIGEIPFNLQAHLLRVLQSREVMRVGGTRVIPVNVRIIAATNKNLKAMIDKGEFRIDLFYRINTLRLSIPPLRDRIQDIPPLVEHFISDISNYYHKVAPPLSQKLMKCLQLYDWPGNIRQLMSFVERYVILSGQDMLVTDDHLAMQILQGEFEEDNTAEHYKPSLIIPIGTLDEMEKSIFKQLELVFEDKQMLAEELGISRTTLWRKLQNIKEDKDDFL